MELLKYVMSGSVISRIVKEPIMYREAVLLLCDDKKVEVTLLELSRELRSLYRETPHFRKYSYSQVLAIGLLVLHYRYSKEMAAEDTLVSHTVGTNEFLRLVQECGGECLLNVLDKIGDKKKSILTLHYVYSVSDDILGKMLHLSDAALQYELREARTYAGYYIRLEDCCE